MNKHEKQTTNAFCDYIACALWSSGEEFDSFTIEDISPESLQTLLDYWLGFAKEYQDTILLFMEQNGVDLAQVAHSFWLSSQGHGAGFFDFNGESAKQLQNVSKAYRLELYIGDDKKVYTI